jgi:hypothetical protein
LATYIGTSSGELVSKRTSLQASIGDGSVSSMLGFARRDRAFADFDFPIMDVLDRLTRVAHVKLVPAAGARHEVIGFGFGDAVGVAADIWRDHNHGRPSRVSRSKSTALISMGCLRGLRPNTK